MIGRKRCALDLRNARVIESVTGKTLISRVVESAPEKESRRAGKNPDKLGIRTGPPLRTLRGTLAEARCHEAAVDRAARYRQMRLSSGR
jgi:hypothetical protein